MSATAIPARQQRIHKISLGWLCVLILSTLIALGSARYFFMPVREATGGGDSGEHFQQFSVRLLPHILGGVLALIVGPWQFLTRLRARRPGLHRWMGYVYFSAVGLGSIAGLTMALVSMGGLASHLGFGLLAVAWFGSAVVALRAALHHDYAAHRRWMIRNYALTFAAVTLRIELPFMTAALHMPFLTAYIIVSWLCWVPNSIAAETWLQKQVKIAR